MSYKNTAKAVEVDQRAELSLMCKAHGCPKRWSVQTGEVTACSYHAWADTKDWPRITEQIRMGLAGLPKTPESREVREMLSRVRGSIGNVSERIPA